MAKTFNAEIHHLADVTQIRLAGVIDEDNDLSTLSNHLRGNTTVIHLGGILEINNCGTRDWVRFLEEAQSRSTVILSECSPAFVAKLNLVGNFAGQAYLRSVYLPYFCQQCNIEKALLISLEELSISGAKAPICRCDVCDSIMTFDELEESYFAFVETAIIDIPDSIMDLLEDIDPEFGHTKLVSASELGQDSLSNLPLSPPSTGSRSHGSVSKRTSTQTGSGANKSSAVALRRLREKTSYRATRFQSNMHHPLKGNSKTRLYVFLAIGIFALATLTLVLYFSLR